MDMHQSSVQIFNRHASIISTNLTQEICTPEILRRNRSRFLDFRSPESEDEMFRAFHVVITADTKLSDRPKRTDYHTDKRTRTAFERNFYHRLQYVETLLQYPSITMTSQRCVFLAHDKISGLYLTLNQLFIVIVSNEISLLLMKEENRENSMNLESVKRE